MTTERDNFVAYLAANEDDAVARGAYADWLDDHDQPEEADRMRKWPAAKAWMLTFVRAINYATYKAGPDGEPLVRLDGAGNPVVGKWGEPEYVVDEDSLGDPHTYADAIEAGHSALRGETYCFGSDAGADFFRNGCESYLKAGARALGETGADRRAEFFRNWSVLTGVAVPDAVANHPPFRCAC